MLWEYTNYSNFECWADRHTAQISEESHTGPTRYKTTDNVKSSARKSHCPRQVIVLVFRQLLGALRVRGSWGRPSSPSQRCCVCSTVQPVVGSSCGLYMLKGILYLLVCEQCSVNHITILFWRIVDWYQEWESHTHARKINKYIYMIIFRGSMHSGYKNKL